MRFPDDLARELQRVRTVIQADPVERERVRKHVAAKADESLKRVHQTRRFDRKKLDGDAPGTVPA